MTKPDPAYHYLTVHEDGQLYCHHQDVELLVKTYDGLIAILKAHCESFDIDPEDLTVMCSSSLDFPEEYTDDAAVIELCHKIRNMP